jgi:hypothetical protein
LAHLLRVFRGALSLLFFPDNSLFACKKIPVTQRTGFGMQATENSSEFRTKEPPRGPFS